MFALVVLAALVLLVADMATGTAFWQSPARTTNEGNN